MMQTKQIKFRAWDKEIKKMFYFDELMFLPDCRGWDNHVIGCEPFEDGFSDDLIFQEYTGLKDKNGKEIYEGDIIEEDESDRTIRYLVIWTNMGFCCMPLIEFDRRFTEDIQRNKIENVEKWIQNQVYETYPECIDFLYYYIKNSIVVGNRFENQELLKLND